MKQTKRSIAGLLIVATTISIFMQCKEKETAKIATECPAESSVNPSILPVAYVDADSLLAHFEFYNALINSYEEKMSKRNSSLTAGYQKLQSEAATFQQKVQNNAFLTQDRYNQEQTRLQRMEEDLRSRATQIEQELAVEQRTIQQQLSDSLSIGIKEFNTPQIYQMIFTKTGNSTILYADNQYNITHQVLEFLNKRFKPNKK
ncbi:MAG: OmpH family outer membrane protein [Candidatus Symbiothrix sp.]|jgi:outer membrane protein|nr:OmpH family outer membrane protein [Candidatus Symbiothrix sp.]